MVTQHKDTVADHLPCISVIHQEEEGDVLPQAVGPHEQAPQPVALLKKHKWKKWSQRISP